MNNSEVMGSLPGSLSGSRKKLSHTASIPCHERDQTQAMDVTGILNHADNR